MSTLRPPLLELAPVVLAGLTAGGTLYISVIESPARLKLPPSQQLVHWRTTFPYARDVFMPAGLLLVPALCVTAHTTGKALYYTGAACFGSLMPFTALALKGINNRLLAMRIEGEAEEKEVVELVARWGRRHLFRGLACLGGFGVCLYAATSLAPRK